MRILFVNHNISLWINVGLTYVMSAVAESHDVFLVDRMKHQKNFDTYLLSALAKINPHIIALSVNSYTVNEACMLARAVRSSFPDIIVVFGGVHPTIMPEETIVLQDVDAIVVGEGELSFLEYANCLEERREPYGVQGVWFKDKVGNIVRNPLRPFTED